MTRRPARLLIATAGATNAILAVTVAQGLSAETTYAGASMVAAAATLAAPLSLLAAGVVVEPAALSAL
jgi:hypothetical protein